ncbi:hypothetical protein Tco_0400238 [Tanacetum coccineum]
MLKNCCGCSNKDSVLIRTLIDRLSKESQGVSGELAWGLPIKSQGSSAGLSVSCESAEPGNPRPMQFSRSWWYHTYKGIFTDITSVTTWLSETGIKAATSVSTVSTNGYTTIGRHKDGQEYKLQFLKNLLQHLHSSMKLKGNLRKDEEQGWNESRVLGNVWRKRWTERISGICNLKENRKRKPYEGYRHRCHNQDLVFVAFDKRHIGEDAIISLMAREYSTEKLMNEIGELRAISAHVLGAAGVQIPQNNLDNLQSFREEGDGATKRSFFSSTLFFSLLLGVREILSFFVLPEGFDPLALVEGFTPVEDNKGLLVTLGMFLDDLMDVDEGWSESQDYYQEAWPSRKLGIMSNLIGWVQTHTSENSYIVEASLYASTVILIRPYSKRA